MKRGEAKSKGEVNGVAERYRICNQNREKKRCWVWPKDLKLLTAYWTCDCEVEEWIVTWECRRKKRVLRWREEEEGKKKIGKERSNMETPTICWKHMLILACCKVYCILKYTQSKKRKTNNLIGMLINPTALSPQYYFIGPFEEKAKERCGCIKLKKEPCGYEREAETLLHTVTELLRFFPWCYNNSPMWENKECKKITQGRRRRRRRKGRDGLGFSLFCMYLFVHILPRFEKRLLYKNRKGTKKRLNLAKSYIYIFLV